MAAPGGGEPVAEAPARPEKQGDEPPPRSVSELSESESESDS